MQSKPQSCNLISRTISRAAKAVLAISTLFALTMVLPSAQGQTFNVIHTFTGPDGGQPRSGVTLDAAGNLYGTTLSGGGWGTVFQLKRFHGAWLLNNIFTFNGLSNHNDLFYPYSGVVFGPDGALYGTTADGGLEEGGADTGGVYSVTPTATACQTAVCPWTGTVLYVFTFGNDGASPGNGNLTFDSAGNLYGTTTGGGAYGRGTVFKLTPSNGGWTESILYSFAGGDNDGSQPVGGVVLDKSGNLYGTTLWGPGTGCYNLRGCGIVFQLTPTDSGWQENILHYFAGNDGFWPSAGLIIDQSGNLYGATSMGGAWAYSGTVFELSPTGGSWTFALLYEWPDGYNGPLDNLAMDSSGVLYGTTGADGAYQQGSVFKLTPSDSGWVYTSLHDFTGGNDGGEPISNVSWDTDGNLYGTTFAGGAHNEGVVWEITP
jgi:uncharacterized repeat protein (TIGR03803 family)